MDYDAVLSEFLRIVEEQGIVEAKRYGKQLGPEGRILLNAIGLYEGNQFRSDSDKPIHRLALWIAEGVKRYERNQAAEQLVTTLLGE